MDTQAAGVGRFTDDSCYEGKNANQTAAQSRVRPAPFPRPVRRTILSKQAGQTKVKIAKQTLCTFALARMPKLGATKTSLPGKTLPYENTVRAGLQGRWWPQPAAFTDSPTDVGAPLPYLRTLAFDLNPLKVRARRWLEATSLARLR